MNYRTFIAETFLMMGKVILLRGKTQPRVVFNLLGKKERRYTNRQRKKHMVGEYSKTSWFAENIVLREPLPILNMEDDDDDKVATTWANDFMNSYLTFESSSHIAPIMHYSSDDCTIGGLYSPFRVHERHDFYSILEPMIDFSRLDFVESFVVRISNFTKRRTRHIYLKYDKENGFSLTEKPE